MILIKFTGEALVKCFEGINEGSHVRVAWPAYMPLKVDQLWEHRNNVNNSGTGLEQMNNEIFTKSSKADTDLCFRFQFDGILAKGYKVPSGFVSVTIDETGHPTDVLYLVFWITFISILFQGFFKGKIIHSVRNCCSAVTREVEVESEGDHATLDQKNK
jgi:hypothetical protein